MLNYLSIRHLAVIEQCEIEFKSGLSVLTGETGAGKSILLDALGLVLGERAHNSIIRDGCEEAEVSALFDLSQHPTVLAWLKAHDLEADNECIVRRCITSEGRSRAYLNGRAVPLAQCRELAEQLISIHGQHRHQGLLKKEHQRQLVDEFAHHADLITQVSELYSLYQQKLNELENVKAKTQSQAELELLSYQLHELRDLDVKPNEIETLEAEHKKLTHAKEWIELCFNTSQQLKNESSSDVLSTLHQSIQNLEQLRKHTNELDPCCDLMINARIQLEEAVTQLEDYHEKLYCDPKRLLEVEQRLDILHRMARKHQVSLGTLAEHTTQLEAELLTLTNADQHLTELERELKVAKQQYECSATKLSKSRRRAAKTLELKICEILHKLELPKARFEVDFTAKKQFSSSGLDEIDFMVSLNPGLALQPLRKIASGGELSRISLAIQVITAQKMVIPTLIFDEVDAGIGGKTAATVGELLKQLAQQAQILCVTHSPQIMAQANTHFKISKKQTQSHTTTQVKRLDSEEKIQELARMIGGAKLTESALHHAKEMLENA